MDLSYKKAKLHTEISVASIGLIVSISGMNTGRMVYNKIMALHRITGMWMC